MFRNFNVMPVACAIAIVFSMGNGRATCAQSSAGARPELATPVDQITVADGFQVELLYSVPSEEQGSWVCMTVDPVGRLIVSDQYGKLYRVVLPKTGSDAAIQVEPIDVEIGMAQGLLYAFDSLYVMVNGQDRAGQGLHRVRDTDGDDKFDTVEHLRLLDGASEHGPHAVILSPDGKSLFVCCGNHTSVPELAGSRVPQNWDEDQLLPRMWDAGGHAVGRMAPGGWIARVDPDGKNWELFASGFRNEYDIAFNPEGELFTYDADMEWDVGTPWYRPTRVNHVISGAEFGWRSGTGKWPVWYPDSLGSVVDVGPGSPTGIVFGTSAKFPEKYQRSLFISDWSYGVIYAVHLESSGSSYTGTLERFAAAAPLPVTDIVVNPTDGAMYFTIGGRRTQSGLYRVTYTGDKPTTPVKSVVDVNAPQRAIRHRLEALHHADAVDAIEIAWPYLSDPDHDIRFAARIAIEQQPVEQWQANALVETDPQGLLTALLALARNGEPAMQGGLLSAMSRLSNAELNPDQQLEALRVLSLSMIRMGRPNQDVCHQIATALRGNYPSDSERLNRELCSLLVYLDDPHVINPTLDLMESSPTQEAQLHFALALRVQKTGWNLDQRRRYFAWFNQAAGHRGGHSFSGFLKNIRNEAIETLTDQERTQLEDVLNAVPAANDPTFELSQRKFVKKWTVDELLPQADAKLTGRDFENGRRMFTVTACYRCHRFEGQGGLVGPDLTAVGRRYNSRTIVESLLEPDKVISDQYQATQFLLSTGKAIVGRVANLNGDRLMVMENMLDPGNLTSISREEIDEMMPSRVSPMPSGLLDTLNESEVLDLIAYLKSGGDANDPAFRK